MKRALVKTLITLVLTGAIASYDFSSTPCTSQDMQQSPININYNQTTFSNTNYFRILSNNFKPITPSNKWTYFPNELAIGVEPTSQIGDFGSMLFVKDWAIYNFILKKIIFRIGSENSIENSISNAEMQLVFLQDSNYYSPGKRIFLDANYLIVSVPFRLNTDPNVKNSRLFEFMNLKAFASNPTANANIGMARDIKLHQFIVHQPAFLYEGTLTYPECQKALWLLMTQFHPISSTDLSLLKNAISANFPLTDNKPFNTRDLKPLRTDTPIYRNYEDLNALVMKSNLLNYNNDDYVKNCLMFLLIVLALLF